MFLSRYLILTEKKKRRDSDRKTNSKKTLILGPDGRFQVTKWRDVHVGAIIKVSNKDPFPADIIAIATSEPQGLCYVETSSLDGETNLKIKRARPETIDVDNEPRASDFKATITCEQPNNRLYSFEGSMAIDSNRVSLDIDNILLRGSTLRNTDWVIGIVIFTGHETKLMKNTNKTPHKASQVERMTNRLIFIILAVQILLCLICTIGIMIFTSVSGISMWYMPIDSVNKGGASPHGIAFLGFRSFWTFLILFNNLIPISLYVSLEIARFIQGHIMSQDLKMYHQESDSPAIVRTS
jgi:magnesium-transporting ATPase (P-type)